MDGINVNDCLCQFMTKVNEDDLTPYLDTPHCQMALAVLCDSTSKDRNPIGASNDSNAREYSQTMVTPSGNRY